MPRRPHRSPAQPSSPGTWRSIGRGSWSRWTASSIGRLKGTKGVVWQYTAIDVGSAYAWAALHVTPRNPSSKYTSQLARRVAKDLKRFGWALEAVMSDNGGEFRARRFRDTVAELGAEHRFIRSGRPQTNGCVERLQGTILEECWKPSFARFLVPAIPASERS